MPTHAEFEERWMPCDVVSSLSEEETAKQLASMVHDHLPRDVANIALSYIQHNVELALKQLPLIVQALCAQEEASQFEAACTIRQLLYEDNDSLIREVIKAGVVPCLVNLLNQPNLELQVRLVEHLPHIVHPKLVPVLV